jgi:hypothetical protein
LNLEAKMKRHKKPTILNSNPSVSAEYIEEWKNGGTMEASSNKKKKGYMVVCFGMSHFDSLAWQ